MSGHTGMEASAVRLLRQDQLDGGLTGGLSLQRLAEITHLPTGIASGQIETASVPAGGSAPVWTAAGDDMLLHVSAGHARVTWGPGLADATQAGPGDTLLVPAGTTFRMENASPSAPLQLIIVRGG